MALLKADVHGYCMLKHISLSILKKSQINYSPSLFQDLVSNSLQNRCDFFCIFQPNGGKCKASVKYKSRARGGA